MIRLLISTCNRAGSLERCLDRMTRVSVPEGGLEIVVVDNGSSDETLSVLRHYSDLLPLRRLREPRRGKNVALNYALDDLGSAAADSELLVFSDDDVLPCPEWLTNLQDAARRHPEADLFGGPIEIVWTTPPPPWLGKFQAYRDVLFAETAREDGPCRPAMLWGPNLAIRGRCFRDGLRYDPGIGPNGSADFAMGSETELMGRLGAAGASARFVGNAAVGHMIDGAALTKAGIFRRAARHGAGVAKRDFVGMRTRALFGVPLFLWRGLVRCMIAIVPLVFSGRSDAARFEMHWHLGAIRQCRVERS